MGRGRAQNRYNRYVKGMRRVKDDRNTHGTEGLNDPRVYQCECFSDDVSKGRGWTFSKFADTPHPCSCWMCSINRRHYGLHLNELRAPRIDEEWD